MRATLLAPAPPPGRAAAIVLAVGVHLALAALLFYGINWQSRPPLPVEVELVIGEPTPAAPPAEEVRPEAPPEPTVDSKPEAKAEAPPKPAPKPEIAQKAKPVKQAAQKPSYDPLRRQLEEEIKQTAQRKSVEAINQEQATLRAVRAAAQRTAAQQAWRAKIAAKIKGNIVRPGNVSGNPEATVSVHLLPDGSLLGEPKMTRSTGNAALDAAIERAIKKSDPLPKPDDPSVFDADLSMTFKPFED